MESTEYTNSTEVSEKVVAAPEEEKQSNALPKNSVLLQKCEGSVRGKQRRGVDVKCKTDNLEEELPPIEEHLEQDGSATVLLPSGLVVVEVDADDPEMELPLSEQQEIVRDEEDPTAGPITTGESEIELTALPKVIKIKAEIIQDMKIEPINDEDIKFSKTANGAKTKRSYNRKSLVKKKVEDPVEAPEPVRSTRSSRNMKTTIPPAAVVVEEPIKKRENVIKKKEKDVESSDLEKCRICLGADALVSIFTLEEKLKISERIMSLCTNVKIAEKDFLPQFICSTCLESLHVALNFKALCEATDKELRSKLTRSKNKIRRPTEFVLIDCDDLSEESEDALLKAPKDDEEFHLSNASAISEPESDSDSDFGSKKKPKRTPKRRKMTTGRKRGPKRKKIPKSPITPIVANTETNETSENNVIYIKEEQSSDDEVLSPPKKRRSKIKTPKTEDDETKTPDSKKKEHQCIYCNETYGSANALREHKKTHAGEKPFTCHICNKAFKLVGSFNSHLRKHKEDDNLMCTKCEKHFPNKTEHKKHMMEEHGEPAASFICEKCKRAFTTAPRLERHKENKCPGFEVSAGKKAKPEIDAITLGRDLFKCVAPMTTTYWSDSFSD